VEDVPRHDGEIFSSGVTGISELSIHPLFGVARGPVADSPTLPHSVWWRGSPCPEPR